jgi:pimeloyl-ACP methyl ester carboxylesterase
VIAYLHGFNSSPQSHKAQVLGRYMEQQGVGEEYACPALPPLAAEAIQAIEKLTVGKPGVCFVGSSLGGFYATYLAEKHDAGAVLINPAIDPHVGLRAYLGRQKNLHTGEPYLLTEAHQGVGKAAGAAHYARPLPVDRRDRRRGARLPPRCSALRGRRAARCARRRPQPAELPGASGPHPRVRPCSCSMRKMAS